MTVEASVTNRGRLKETNRKSDSGKRKSNNKNRNKNNPKSKSKTNGENGKNTRFLELVSLTKRFEPITINGVPTQRVIDKYLESGSKAAEEIKIREECSNESSKSHSKSDSEISLQMSKLRIKNKPLNRYLYKLVNSSQKEAIYISFLVSPSDPDFPFDLQHLKLSLIIPAGYPGPKSHPSVIVLNSDIPKGFAINIENGFKRIVNSKKADLDESGIKLAKGQGLVSYINSLDINLEIFLKEQKRDTVKFVKMLKMGEKQKQPENPAPKSQLIKPTEASPRTTHNLNEKFTPTCENLISEVIDKGIQLKLFNKSNSKRIYRMEIPIFSLQPSTPHAWSLHKKLELSLTIPCNYPDFNLKVAFVPNFSRNTILKYQTDDDFERLSKMESNISANFNSYKFESISILSRLNYLANNFMLFCSNKEDFENWITQRKHLVDSDSI